MKHLGRAKNAISSKLSELDPFIDLRTGGTYTCATEASYLIGSPTDGTIPFLSWAGVNTRRIENRGNGEGDCYLTEASGTNLLLQSQAFNLTWSPSLLTVTGTTNFAPDGVFSGSTLNFTANANSQISQSFAVVPADNAQAVCTVYLRAPTTPQTVGLYLLDKAGATGSVVTCSLTSGSWQRFELNKTVGAGTGTPALIIRNHTDAAARAVYAWGAQVECNGSTTWFPTSYIRTTTTTGSRAAPDLAYTLTQFPVSFYDKGFSLQCLPAFTDREFLSSSGVSGFAIAFMGASNDGARIVPSGGNVFFQFLGTNTADVVSQAAATWSRNSVLKIKADKRSATLEAQGFVTSNGRYTEAPSLRPFDLIPATLHIGNLNGSTTQFSGRIKAVLLDKSNNPPTAEPGVVISGTVVVSGTLTANTVNATAVQWTRGTVFDAESGTDIDINIPNATASTYVVTNSDIGYKLKSKAFFGALTSSSNVVRYDPTTDNSVIEVFKIRNLATGSVSAFTGSKLGVILSQSVGARQPIAATGSFNNSYGLTFDGLSHALAGPFNFSAYNNIRVVLGAVDQATALSVPLELTPSAATSNGGFNIAVNVVAGKVEVNSRGTVSYGGVGATETLATASVMSFNPTTTNASGAAFIRKNGTALSLATEAAGNNPGNFANDNLNLGARNNGASLLWSGTFGGAIVFMSGGSEDDNLLTTEAYVTNAAGFNVLDLTQGGTFTRASEASYLTAAPTDGTTAFLAWAPSGSRRVENRGDGLGNMLLMEGSRTNLIKQSNDLGNASWTLHSGQRILSQSSVDGTLTAVQITASTSQYGIYDGGTTVDAINYNFSVWTRSPSLSQYGAEVGTAALSAVQLKVFATGSATFARPSDSTTYNTGAFGVNAVTDIGPGAAMGAPYPASARNAIYCLPQLETGYFPTSPIRTTTAVGTRQIDSLIYTTSQYPSSLLNRGFVVQIAPDFSSTENAASANYYAITTQTGAGLVIFGQTGHTIGTYDDALAVKASLTPTWSRGQLITITVSPQNGIFTVAGATTGNGTVNTTPWSLSSSALRIGARYDGVAPMYGRFGTIIYAL